MSTSLPVIQPTSRSSPVACCAPLTEAPLSPDQAQQLALLLKAIAEPTRLRVLSLLLSKPDLEACTCDLTEPLGLTQPTVTHHLRTLVEAGLVAPDRKVGRFTYYRVIPEALASLAGVLTPAALG